MEIIQNYFIALFNPILNILPANYFRKFQLS